MFIKIIVIHQLRTFINMRTIEHLRLSISFFFSHISLYLFRSFSFLAHCFFHVSLPPCIFLTDPFLITLFLSLSHFPFDSRPILFSLSRFHLYWIYFLFVCLSFLSSLFSSLQFICLVHRVLFLRFLFLFSSSFYHFCKK